MVFKEPATYGNLFSRDACPFCSGEARFLPPGDRVALAPLSMTLLTSFCYLVLSSFFLSVHRHFPWDNTLSPVLDYLSCLLTEFYLLMFMPACLPHLNSKALIRCYCHICLLCPVRVLQYLSHYIVCAQVLVWLHIFDQLCWISAWSLYFPSIKYLSLLHSWIKSDISFF